MLQRAFLLLAVLLNFSGCQQEWHITITGFDATGHPVFCVTQWRKCSGRGVSIHDLYVYEAALGYYPPRVVWAIHRKSSEPFREFTYGIVPEGWEQIGTSEPLKVDTFYQVGLNYFRLRKDAQGILSAEVLYMDEFYEKVRGQKN